MFIAEIGINHLGNINTLKKYIKHLNQTNIEGVTVQILRKNFFKGKFKSYFINRKVLLETIINLSKKKIGIITDNFDDLFNNKNVKYIDFFKILGSQVKDKKLLNKLKKIGKPIFLSNRGLKKNEETKLVDLVRKNKNFNLIHTQLKTDRKYTNLKNIKILKRRLNKNQVCFGSHCKDKKMIINSLKYKPKKIFFYIKEDSKKYYPDDTYAICLKDIKKLIKKIK